MPTASGVAVVKRIASGTPSIPLPTASGVADSGAVVIEIGGGSAKPHGVYIPRVRQPKPDEISDKTAYDDAELALLAVAVIEEFDP